MEQAIYYLGYVAPSATDTASLNLMDRFQDHCHNGMKCTDRRCMCTDMAKQLFDPHGGFCVEPAQSARSFATDDKWAAEFYEPQQNVVGCRILTP